MRTMLLSVASLLLVSSTDGEASTDVISVILECGEQTQLERDQKNKLVSAVEKYRYCIWEYNDSSVCLPDYDKMSVIYSEYRTTYNSFEKACAFNGR